MVYTRQDYRANGWPSIAPRYALSPAFNTPAKAWTNDTEAGKAYAIRHDLVLWDCVEMKKIFIPL